MNSTEACRRVGTTRLVWAATLCLLAAGVARADDETPASAPVPAPTSSAPAGAGQPKWEGAVGLLFNYSPAYQGASDNRLRGRPGLFLRYGRFSATTTGGFVTRRNDEVQRGLAAELISRDRLRVSLSARLDGGRDEGDDPMLKGLGNVRATVRGRLTVVQSFGHGWKLSAGLSPDLLGRGGGTLLDAGLSYEWALTPTLRANVGTGITAADHRYMQSYFGVTPEQSARSGLRVYEPPAGLRDLGFGAGLRADLGPHWLGFVNVGTSQLKGPTLDSPLTRRRDTWGINGGLAWRF